MSPIATRSWPSVWLKPSAANTSVTPSNAALPSARTQLRYLVEEEERLKVNLQKSEAAVANYKATHPDALQLGGGTVSTGTQPGSGAGAGGSRGGIVEDKLRS